MKPLPSNNPQPTSPNGPAPSAVPEGSLPHDHTPQENPKPLQRTLAVFSPDQLAQVFAWLNHHTYEQTSKLIAEHFGRNVKTGALFRFFQQAAPAHFLRKPTDATAAREVLMFAATGVPDFTQAAIAALEEAAFHLALNSLDNERALQKLKRIIRITCRAKNTATSARLATIQQKKFDLRADELAYKKYSSAVRLALKERAQNLKAASRNSAHPVNPVEVSPAPLPAPQLFQH